MKKLALTLLLGFQTACAGIWVTPEFVGNGAGDSVVVSFCTFDTSYYPRIADADSIVALRYGADNALVDSLSQSAANLYRMRKGWYELHYQGANSTGALGTYRVYLRVKTGGDWRGAASVSYRVIDDEVGSYFARLAADADSIKDTLGLITHNTASSGTGAYACTLYVFDSGSQSAIQGVFLRVLNSSETATAAVGESNSNGRLMLSLDAASYHLLPYLSGYNFGALPKALTVTAAGVSDTIWASRFDPGTAPVALLCRVYGYVQSLSAGGIEGVVVTARIAKTPLTRDGVVVSPYAVSTATDTSGYWYLDLVPSGDIEPDDTKYDFTFYYPSGTILRKQFAAPESGSVWFRW
jgi:hypothetical protein